MWNMLQTTKYLSACWLHHVKNQYKGNLSMYKYGWKAKQTILYWVWLGFLLLGIWWGTATVAYAVDAFGVNSMEQTR